MKSNPFQKKTEATVSEMIAFLESKGYVVRKLTNFKTFSDKAVLSAFYEYQINQYGLDYVAECKHEPTNKKYLKEFQKNIKSLGYTKEFANFLVIKMLESIFTNYSRLGIQNRLRTLEDILSEKGLWLSAQISRFRYTSGGEFLEGDAEWFEGFMNKYCETEDEHLSQLREDRKKELLDGKEEENR